MMMALWDYYGAEKRLLPSGFVVVIVEQHIPHVFVEMLV